jgi:hypothetical protein
MGCVILYQDIRGSGWCTCSQTEGMSSSLRLCPRAVCTLYPPLLSHLIVCTLYQPLLSHLGMKVAAIFPTRGVDTQGCRTLCSDSRREPRRLTVDTFPFVELVKVIPLVAKLLSMRIGHTAWALPSPCGQQAALATAWPLPPLHPPPHRPAAPPLCRPVIHCANLTRYHCERWSHS